VLSILLNKIKSGSFHVKSFEQAEASFLLNPCCWGAVESDELQGRLLMHKDRLKLSLESPQKLTAAPKTAGAESERVILPRGLVFLYTMRNKRDFGHVGGDVDSNEIDNLDGNSRNRSMDSGDVSDFRAQAAGCLCAW
jgi:hypothetical protein